ncbi:MULTISPECIES: peptide MFS transporter [Prauserella salsuginis group]|uniref:POT family proton-dependent oligopeptide transporter n=2 Tax=Prauserella salsuginis group TaxID=2893672 RepID=A0A839XRK9_9PSEU|nr:MULTISPECIES: oligopeptide:H+ symporter [Prauserella salsuginis group]MBB3663263.1 POT family proton-dependent oligopeptide transporter [Prauserella sediminis]MCR3720910.1 proton-dependent oligopeptide transporter, POT family [Prauserella flava]MCR3735009.1 proton-dependent oligopeptide transporter, POT family [Prauserella salsuginis]
MSGVDTEPAGAGSAGSGNEKTFFGHPRGLANLFGVEMWERFSFYGMLGILPLYLYFSAADGGLEMDRGTALGIVGAYGGLVYLSTILAAWIADRLFSAERTLFYSAVIIMIGHLALAVLPGYAGVGAGLLCVALGSGGVKANATAVLGTLYSEGDERRDAGFTIFYMGVNLGAFVGTALTGFFQHTVGFHVGFGLAAAGMALGLIQYSIGRSNLGETSRIVPNPLPASRRPLVALVFVAVAVACVLLVLTGAVTAQNLGDVAVWVAGLAAAALFVILLTSSRVSSVERSRVMSFIPMFVASAAFFALFQQQFTVLEVYSDERLNRDLFGWEMPISWVNLINPVFILILAPIFATVWAKLGHRQPSTPMKFALGTGVMGVAFLLFLPMAGGEGNTSPLLAIVGILATFTVAEMFLSPVGLSLSTKLAPQAFRAQMVALNYLSVSLGTALSGSLAEYYSTDGEASYFGTVGGVALGIGVLIAVLSPYIRKLMAGVR